MDPRPPDGFLILTGVELEARALARHLELPSWEAPSGPPRSGRAFGRGRLRVASGGLRAAYLTERWPALLDGLGRPLVISAGVCGALDPALVPGALVCPERVLAANGDEYALGESSHRARVAERAAPVHGGRLVTAGDLVGTPSDKARLRRATGAVAVDMESAAIVRAAVTAGLPWLVLRGVADGAGDAVPPGLARLVDDEGRIRLAGAVALALTRPRVVAGAIELGRNTRRALARVARALAALVA